MITTRSRGFPLHDYPGDFWRYEPDDMRAISADCDLVRMERDEADPGIFVAVRTPEDPAWEPLDLTGWLFGRFIPTPAAWNLRTNHRRHWPPLTTLTALLQVVYTLQQDMAALREDLDRQSTGAQALIEATRRDETAKRAAETEVARLTAEIKAVYGSRTFRWTVAACRQYARIRQLSRKSDHSTR